MAKAASENQDTGAVDSAVDNKQDLVSEIGTLTYPRAVKAFGKDNALKVLHEVARIGGHGMFDDSDFLSPLFGGLQMPSPEVVRPPDQNAFASLPDAEFHYEQAKAQYAELQKQASVNRAAINDLFNAHFVR